MRLAYIFVSLEKTYISFKNVMAGSLLSASKSGKKNLIINNIDNVFWCEFVKKVGEFLSFPSNSVTQ